MFIRFWGPWTATFWRHVMPSVTTTTVGVAKFIEKIGDADNVDVQYDVDVDGNCQMERKANLSNYIFKWANPVASPIKIVQGKLYADWLLKLFNQSECLKINVA